MEGGKDVCTGGRAVANDATAKTKISRLDGLPYFLNNFLCISRTERT